MNKKIILGTIILSATGIMTSAYANNYVLGSNNTNEIINLPAENGKINLPAEINNKFGSIRKNLNKYKMKQLKEIKELAKNGNFEGARELAEEYGLGNVIKKIKNGYQN
ncbi:hypothetical protein [Candidatus Vampirococcus lugosii]|uniref:Uncharacterized protein n=1 Tax=Candidatus Vampirococcus lugosii TaxID=2789015 RepID=A0ABS5QMW6_9BACT|nr:hypothetical protein [Candidatus Vampirococcus lugosii]MBS8122031.1 hypothetical protein [Candidatus Vampirococcus lugosii]